VRKVKIDTETNKKGEVAPVCRNFGLKKKEVQGEGPKGY